MATVLVVDDAAAMRFLVSKTLDDLGFSTLTATNGEAAIDAICKFKPGAIVTDLEMPGIDGEQLIAHLRNSENVCLRELPIIVCSSKIDRSTLATLARLDVNAVVPKPVDIQVLAKAALANFSW